MASAEETLARGETGRAIELLTALQASSPDAPGLGDALYRAYLSHGKTLLDVGEIDGSWAMYAKALELRPADQAAQAGQNQVILLKQWRAMETAWGKDDEAALAAAQDVARIDPDYRDIRDKLYALLIAKADRLLSAGDRDGAYSTLMLALTVKPDRPEARERLRPYTPTPVPVPTPRPASAPANVQTQPSSPAQTQPVQAAPAQAAPAQAAPAQAAPVQSQPAQSQPAQSQPATAPSTGSGGAPIRR
jgi:tetratricopeptide (TPR) repeat protein